MGKAYLSCIGVKVFVFDTICENHVGGIEFFMYADNEGTLWIYLVFIGVKLFVFDTIFENHVGVIEGFFMYVDIEGIALSFSWI